MDAKDKDLLQVDFPELIVRHDQSSGRYNPLISRSSQTTYPANPLPLAEHSPILRNSGLEEAYGYVELMKAIKVYGSFAAVMAEIPPWVAYDWFEKFEPVVSWPNIGRELSPTGRFGVLQHSNDFQGHPLSEVISLISGLMAKDPIYRFLPSSDYIHAIKLARQAVNEQIDPPPRRPHPDCEL